MSLKLSQVEQEQFRRDGFIFPVRILDASETADHRGRLEEIETKYGPMHYRHKPYLLMKSAAEIARNPDLWILLKICSDRTFCFGTGLT